MGALQRNGLRCRYSILDPTGNITALVESEVPVGDQPSVASAIMARHPQVEQVGFVRIPAGAGSGAQAELRMAGGEFCGNATMSAAALYLLRTERRNPDAPASCDSATRRVLMRVSGAADLVEVHLTPMSASSFSAEVCMPRALGIEYAELTYEGMQDTVPVVRMEGISHVIVESVSPLFALMEQRDTAELAVRQWCDQLKADGLGLMFVQDGKQAFAVTPLVFVPGSGTVFWENSCASGSSAVGRFVASSRGVPVELALQEPGGMLRVKSDPATGETLLAGSVCLVECFGQEEHLSR